MSNSDILSEGGYFTLRESIVLRPIGFMRESKSVGDNLVINPTIALQFLAVAMT